MIPPHLLDLELPAGRIPTAGKDTATPEQNDAWQWKNTRLRWQRGDFSRSDTPVNVMFEIERPQPALTAHSVTKSRIS